MSETRIAIIGLGYVGLPLSLQFARSCTVIGIDIDPAKIDALKKGKSYIKHVARDGIREAVESGKFVPSGDFAEVRKCEAVIICVPTPLTKTREPDLSYVLDTGRAIAPHLQPGMLVVLESTTYPGTTDEDLRAVLEENSPLLAGVGHRCEGEKSEGSKESNTFPLSHLQPSHSPGRRMRAGEDFHLAYSPEREDPGNPNSKVAKIPKIVGGLTPACRDKAVALYSRAVEKVVPVSSCKVAEAAKLLENIFRSVNIALVNELKMIYAAMGIDIWEVIEAAKTKPFGFMPFYPGPGLGGHCIPIDPFYLSWKAREVGKSTRFIELAGEINTAMPDYVIQRLTEALNSSRKSVNGSKVLLIGLAYKADVDDMRESPTFILMDKLEALGAEIAYYDPHIPEIGPTREHRNRQGMRSVEWNEETITGFDAAIIVTAHSAVNYPELMSWCACVVDTRNVLPTNSTATKA
ncbi:MAG TPA: nucleotide sugar dehydrogenase [Chthoniobacterales bacterium]|jgi:UDP-N-acetyl-D-glucosamine dehydrogenase